MKKNSLFVLATALLMSTVLCLNGCSKDEEIGKYTLAEDVDYLSVDTPYCELKYPEDLKDEIKVKESEEDDCYSVEFYTVVGKKNITLYTVYFGEGEGDLIGEFSAYEEAANKDSVDVYLDFADVEGLKLKEKDMNAVYAAMETVNDVLASIDESPDFTSN